MEKLHVVGLLLVGVALLVLSVYLRGRYGDKYELRTIDLVLIILPLMFTLLATGKLKMFDAFGVRADFSELFAEAAGQSIEDQIDNKQSQDIDDLVQKHQVESKGGVRSIPSLIEKKTDALLFKLGHGGYYGPAIREYLEQLIASSYLEYVVLTEPDGRLFGIYTAKELSLYFFSKNDSAYNTFASRLNSAGESDRKTLSELPGFVSVEYAIPPTLSKRQALTQLDKMRVDSLPVIDSRNYFVGTVSRSQLTASLILDVVSRLDGPR